MYVVYLSNEVKVTNFSNGYGYYTGKTHTVAGEIFPETDSKITRYTKVYKSEKVAENSAKAIANKCAYVMSYKIEKFYSIK